MPRSVKAHYFIYENLDALSHQAAAWFVQHVTEAVNARGVARVAISGGSTPKRMFELLADPAQPYLAQMPWHKLELYWVDERCVAPDDKDSNYHMTNEALLSKVPLPAPQIFRMEGELPPEEAANRYEATIRNQFRLEGAELPVFDIIALGMGDDGHTASLFPHTDGINEMMRVVIANHVPQKDTWRITLTWPVLNLGRSVFFLIQGADKAHVLRTMLLGRRDPDTIPSQLVRPQSGVLSLLLDEEAAAELPKPADGVHGELEIKQ
jgi:6-phosphogluconolactonase